jgi:predicted dehydrogenase
MPSVEPCLVWTALESNQKTREFLAIPHKILFVGMGSIGLRNLQSAHRVRPEAKFAALRQESSANLPEPWAGRVTQFTDIDEALTFKPDLVMVCNPTWLHAHTVRQLRPLRAALFIEKPLAHSLTDVRLIHESIQAASRPFFYGCLLRLHPVVTLTAQLIQEGSLGRCLSYSIYCGSYLPDWRPARDYKTTYSAQAQQGGGVTMDLIHEFDYAELWFGAVERIQGLKTRTSDLEIQSDDLCLATVFHQSRIQGQIHLDYFRPVPRRDFEIVCAHGMLRGDLIQGRLEITRRSPDGKTSVESRELPISRDELHDRQSELIFSTLELGKPSPRDIADVARLTERVLDIPFA